MTAYLTEADARECRLYTADDLEPASFTFSFLFSLSSPIPHRTLLRLLEQGTNSTILQARVRSEVEGQEESATSGLDPLSLRHFVRTGKVSTTVDRKAGSRGPPTAAGLFLCTMKPPGWRNRPPRRARGTSAKGFILPASRWPASSKEPTALLIGPLASRYSTQQSESPLGLVD